MRPLAAGSLFVATLCALRADTGVEFFETQVRPIFATHCYSCHSSKAKPLFAGLKLDSRTALTRGSDAGPVLVPNQPDDSKLIQAVRGNLPMKMPPAGRLPDNQIDALVRWVEMGAPWPAENAETPRSAIFDLEQRRREHWAWQPVRSLQPPVVRDRRWALQPSDRFLLAKLEREGLAP